MSGTSKELSKWLSAKRKKMEKRLSEFEEAVRTHQEEKGPDPDYRAAAKKDLDRLRELILKEFTLAAKSGDPKKDEQDDYDRSNGQY
jgi:hypothetical protein